MVSQEDQARWSAVNGVIPLGFVQDLRVVYEQCAFTISPVFFGAGTKIKVAESAAYGRTGVITTHAYRGYEGIFPVPDSFLAAAAPEEMAEHCLTLLQQPDRRRRMAACAHQHSAQLSYQRFRAIVHETVTRVVTKARMASGHNAR
jgi:glycosyltransferase involved in cell wall biosynthesis